MEDSRIPARSTFRIPPSVGEESGVRASSRKCDRSARNMAAGDRVYLEHLCTQVGHARTHTVNWSRGLPRRGTALRKYGPVSPSLPSLLPTTISLSLSPSPFSPSLVRFAKASTRGRVYTSINDKCPRVTEPRSVMNIRARVPKVPTAFRSRNYAPWPWLPA